MSTQYTIPGVYVEEIPRFPPSVAQVETAIPAFIGYTEKRLDLNGNVLSAAIPSRITSLKEFETRFGYAPRLSVTSVRLDADNNFLSGTISTSHYLYHALQLFYANGGGDCYIVSVGSVASGLTWATYATGDIEDGIDALEAYDEPTIICFPDAAAEGGNQLHDRQIQALAQCALLKDRITLCDLSKDDHYGTTLRGRIGIQNLQNGASYTPWLLSTPPKNVTFRELSGSIFERAGTSGSMALENLTSDSGITTAITDYRGVLGSEVEEQLALREESLRNSFGVYKAILNGLNSLPLSVPPSGAVAGVYAEVDRTRGVWKAPANISLNLVLEPTHTFTQSQLGALNIDVNAGKSINAIRSFTGRGTLVWGARTLAGNDNEWRYVSVRRFYNMVEESVKKATEQFVFEPNDANTWVRVQAMIENFLTLQWRQGALQGARQEHAFRVAVGLGKTMSDDDILNGRMIVEIAMAPVRPAEFIILRFEQKMPES